MTAPAWTAWGEHQPALPAAALAMLHRELGTLTPTRPAAVTEARLAPPRLPPEVRDRLAAVLGAPAVLDDDESRARHAGGQSYADLARRRSGDATAAPDAVLRPSDATQVSAALRICSDAGVAVVPWGGGTSVVGGLDAETGGHASLVALDLGRMDALVDIDERSLLATFQPGITTPVAEAALAEHGLTLGHLPQSYERATLGGYVVTRS